MYPVNKSIAKSLVAIVFIWTLVFAFLPLTHSQTVPQPTEATEKKRDDLQENDEELVERALAQNNNETPCGRSNGHGQGLQKRCLRGSSSGVAKGDFNGDGFGDLAIGVPSESVGSRVRAGAVTVIYGSVNGLTATTQGIPPAQFWTQDSEAVPGVSEDGDGFGRALASGDFNGDGFSDLAIGVPGEDISSAQGAGAVNVIYGSLNGLDSTGVSAMPGQLWSQDSDGIQGVIESEDGFGNSLAWGDFNHDGFSDLAIGVPGEDIGSVEAAGAVNVLYGSPGGLDSAGNQLWSQDSTGVPDTSEQDDFFGSTLSAGDFNGDGFSDLAIGAPEEDFSISGNSIFNGGAVNIIYGSFRTGLTTTNSSVPSSQVWSQLSPGIPDNPGREDYFGASLAAGDFDGNGKADLAIAVIREDINHVNTNDDEGAVHVIYGESNGLSVTRTLPNNQTIVTTQFWTQDSPGVPDVAESDDLFGMALAAGDFNGDGKKDLAIGIPNEDLVDSTGQRILNAGAVTIIFGDSSGLSTAGLNAPRPQFFTQGSSLLESAEQFDFFGAALTAWNFDSLTGPADLVIGVPFEDVGSILDAGVVHVLYGSGNGLSTQNVQLFSQNSLGIPDFSEEGDGFGASLY
jgi:hypothetical protein